MGVSPWALDDAPYEWRERALGAEWAEGQADELRRMLAKGAR